MNKLDEIDIFVNSYETIVMEDGSASKQMNTRYTTQILRRKKASGSFCWLAYESFVNEFFAQTTPVVTVLSP